MGVILSALLLFGLIVVPLAARVAADRRADRADRVAADLRAAIRRRLGGDSLVSVQVRAPRVSRLGRVRLIAPAGFEALIEEVWPVVVGRIPADHELVVRPAPPRPAPPAAEPARLPRAA